ncbi:hypothetical protein [Embleya sp. AB8]|uniref:hypothetical protein n=1 Tax=Embleya sp. AB8 TaxID=3156304 RepID=UPI003C77CEC4
MTSTETLTSVFTSVVTSTWKATNLGWMASVRVDGYDWTVLLPPMGRDANGDDEPARAEIFGCEGWGGTEFVTGQATWTQNVAIVDAVMAARRAP